DGEACGRLSRRHRPREGPVQGPGRRVPRQRRVRDAQGGGAQRLDRRGTRHDGNPDIHPPCRRRDHHHVLRSRGGAPPDVSIRMCYNVTMFMVNIADAKAKLSEYVEAAIRGERVLICNRNRPVAALRALEQSTGQPRDLSPMYPGQPFMTDGFLEPMTEADV